jgi:hypothetical protein
MLSASIVADVESIGLFKSGAELPCGRRGEE